MVTLQQEVQARGFTVAHIKTDSIKIPDATPEIIQFCMEFGKKYGYSFEHEATYEKMCLVNDAVYIAKYEKPEVCEQLYGYVPGDNADAAKEGHMWTATGKQFQVPYVFKSLFSHEDIQFSDLCETRSVKQGAIYLDMNEKLPSVIELEKQLENVKSKFRSGKISDLTFESMVKDLEPRIAEGHSYQFIGRVGLFCPVVKGVGGGVLYRQQNDKYYSVAGTKKKDKTPYRWLEAELVEKLGLQDKIDISYYDSLVEDAVSAITIAGKNQGRTFEIFMSDDPLAPYMNVPEGDAEELPFA
jgi:hypothetical protein